MDSGQVILIGGTTCSGKTTLAESLARRLEARYIDLDLFWIVLQRSIPPESAPDLHLLSDDSVYEDCDTDELVERYLAVAEFVCGAIEPLLAHHDIIRRRVVIEGCWVIPRFGLQETFAGRALRVPAKAVFVVESGREAIEARLRSRSSSQRELTPLAWERHIEMQWRFGQAVQAAAQERGLPVLAPEPFSTLETRARGALGLDDA